MQNKKYDMFFLKQGTFYFLKFIFFQWMTKEKWISCVFHLWGFYSVFIVWIYPSQTLTANTMFYEWLQQYRFMVQVETKSTWLNPLTTDSKLQKLTLDCSFMFTNWQSSKNPFSIPRVYYNFSHEIHLTSLVDFLFKLQFML